MFLRAKVEAASGNDFRILTAPMLTGARTVTSGLTIACSQREVF